MANPANPRWRSLLFVGADQPERVAKIVTRGADAVILDLEDAVIADAKAGARAALPDAIAMLAGQGRCGQPVRQYDRPACGRTRQAAVGKGSG